MPVVGHVRPDEHEVGCGEGRNGVADEERARALRDQGQFHLRVVMPLLSRACKGMHRAVRCDELGFVHILPPLQQPEGFTGQQLDLFGFERTLGLL